MLADYYHFCGFLMLGILTIGARVEIVTADLCVFMFAHWFVFGSLYRVYSVGVRVSGVSE